MITYDWNCKTVDAYVQQGENEDVVYNVHWIVTGTKKEEEKEYSSTSIGTQVLDISEIKKFIPFDQVTNEEVVSWTKDAMGEEEIARIQASIADSIELQIKPVSVTLIVGEPALPID